MNLKMTPELEAALRQASSTEAMQQLLSAERDRQTAEIAATEAATAQAAADKAAADKALADKAAADKAAADKSAGEGFSRTEVIGGKELIFEGASQAEVDQMVLNAYRVWAATGGQIAEVAVDPSVAEKVAADAAAAEAARLADLELKWKRGEVSAKEYLEQSGALASYLEAEGISLDALKESVEATQNSSYIQSWASATEQFLNHSDWPGGEKNKAILHNTLTAMDLLDADDKVQAMYQAYARMKELGTIFPYEEGTPITGKTAEETKAIVEAQARAAAAAATPTVAASQVVLPKTSEELNAYIQAAVQKAVADKAAADAAAIEAAKKPRGSSGMFGASTGTFAVAGATEAAVTQADATVAAAMKNASPEEILMAWKHAQLAGGKDPNTAFLEQFSSRRGA
jgi:trimeric autotransporter adhesin